MITLYTKSVKNVFFYSSLLIIAFLYGCTINPKPNPPALNSSPSIKLVISGKKYPELNLRFAFQYRTKNKDCRFRPITDVFLIKKNAPLVAQDVRQYRLIPKGETTFKEEFYLDKYISGKCKWSPAKIFFSVSKDTKAGFSGKWQSLVMIKNDAVDPINNLQIRYKCSANKSPEYRCRTKDKRNKSQSGVIISNNNANIKLVFELDN